jgi:hypothetical protein
MKVDKFLLITVGALLAIIVILLAMGGAAFLCLFVTQGPVINEGPLMQKAYDFNGTLGGFDKVRLEVININGEVNVREGDGDTFAIGVNTRGTERDYERYKIEFTQSESAGVKTLRLEVKNLKEPRLTSSRYVSDITVTIPKNKTYNVELVTVNGRVALGNLTCEQVKMANVNGALESSASASNATYVTVNGRIDVSTSAVKGDIFANTVNGGITISIPKGAPVRINAHVVNGGISNEVPIVISEKSRLGLIGKTANYTEGLYIEATTVNGGIDITTH